MHSGIVNRYYVLCDAHTVCSNNTELSFISILLSSLTGFSFVVSNSDSDILISFLGCLFSFVNNFKRTRDLVL